MPSALSTSPLYRGMPSIVSISNSHPCGISSAAARNNALLSEPRRRLPDIPMIVGKVNFLPRTRALYPSPPAYLHPDDARMYPISDIVQDVLLRHPIAEHGNTRVEY